MSPRSFTIGLAASIGCLGWLGVAQAQIFTGPEIIQTAGIARAKTPNPPIAISLDAVSPLHRDNVAHVMRHPTIVARAAPEEFAEGIYNWLLDHPDRASLAWRRLGIQCAEITRRAPDKFGWSDGQGTEVSWRTVLQTPEIVVWYAEGQTRLNAVSPVVPVKAVAILSHRVRTAADGKRIVVHETDVYLKTDSKAAALVARALGPATPRLAEQGASQLLLFFSGLTRYFEHHPEDIGVLLAAAEPAKPH